MDDRSALEQGLMDDDVAVEVREQYQRLLHEGVPEGEALEAVLYEQRLVALMFPPQAPVIWLALAAAQCDHGRVDDTVRRRATEALDDEQWFAHWASDPREMALRRAALDALRRRLGASAAAPAPARLEVRPAYRALPLPADRREAIAGDLARIRDANPATDFDGPPDPLVREVESDIDRFGAMDDEKADERRRKMTGVLAIIWGEQVRRLGGWDWGYVRDADGDDTLALIEREGRAWVSPSTHIHWRFDEPDDHRNIAWDLYAAIRDGVVPLGTRPGALIPLRDFAERLADPRWPAQRDALASGSVAPELAAPTMQSMLQALQDAGEPVCAAVAELAHQAAAGPADGPPAAALVARRALILRHELDHAVAAASHHALRGGPAGWSAADRTRLAQEIAVQSRRRLELLHTLGLWEDMSAAERALVETPAEALEPAQVMDTSWRAESLACLLWAVGLIDALPPYDTPVDPARLIALMQALDGSFVSTAALRPRTEIEAARTVAETWHWRSRTRQLLEEGRPFPHIPGSDLTSWDGVVRFTAPRAAAGGLIPAPIDEDFPAFGRAYRDLSPEQWSQANSIALERHFALNWLSGYAPGNHWAATPTDT